ncbi:type VII secretion integral membrane protein EccD [Arthrobacter sp. PL16]|uniref:type VII secretion integral membrane protein EccD n=1 Tax=Arthrobacter sp. PL16 TaxID=3071720 RepID=UPI002E02751D|nr:type VII secretion integral membrane protein EccD [Arthrobacter sp. PL16]
MAHAFTRVTLIGTRRHLDLLLPSDRPVGALMPQVLDLLHDEPSDDVAAKLLVTPDGTPLSAGRTLDDAGIADGSSLLLCNAAEAPPAAVVYDVTDLVVDRTADLRGRWTTTFTTATAIVLTALGLWAGAELLLREYLPGSAWWILCSLGGVLLAGGTVAGVVARFREMGIALLVAGWITAFAGILHRGDSLPVVALLTSALTVVLLLAVGIIADRRKAMASAALTLGALTLVWVAATFIAPDPPKAAALTALAGLLVLGLMPKVALSASGLATLDDQRSKGGTIARTDALDAVAAAHASLSFGSVITGVSIGAGLWIIGTDTETQEWTLPLLAALTLATALRARAFPLAAERIALNAASAVGLTALALGALRFLPQQPWLVAVVVLLIAVASALSLAVEPADHVAARGRQQAKRLETVAILASIPLTVGMFGVFVQLLESFR